MAIVTGASDRGIGGEIAARLAEEGAQIAMMARQLPQRLPKKLARRGCDPVSLCGDITRPEDIRALVDATLARFGRIDVLVNNAGVEVAGELATTPTEEWRQVLDVNLSGAIHVTQAVLPHLTRPGGVIVNIGSALSLGGCRGYSVYSASKAGLIGFTQSLAWEIAPERMRVVGVAPALVHTPMVHRHAEKLTPEVWAKIEACHPLGMGRPHDVAAAVAFLASDDARWITGITLPLGWTTQYHLPTDSMLG